MRLFQHNAATKPAWNCNMKPDRRPGCQPIRSPEECPGFYSKKTGEVCNPWDKVKINNFCRDQWRVMAHVFTKEGSERILRLDVDCILSIISQSETVSQHMALLGG